MDKHERQVNVVQVNSKVKDTFFKTLYQSEERRKKLASLLFGIDIEQATIKNVTPAIFGNKENDLAFLCDDAIYCMMEEQSTECPNMPYRILEYISVALRSTVDTEQSLYSRTKVLFPFPKLYVTFVGIEENDDKIPAKVQYDMKLSDSYKSLPEACECKITIDLEVIVHAYDFHMTRKETYEYIERGIIPERLMGYDNDLRDYGLFCNSLRYVQRAEKENERYPMPQNLNSVNDLFLLLLERGIFVDLLSDQEVCDMTAAQFSREDIIKYEGYEQGIDKGQERLNKLIQKLKEDNRVEELLASCEDKELQEKLLKEYGL